MQKLTLTILSENGDFEYALRQVLRGVMEGNRRGWNENNTDCFQYAIEYLYDEDRAKKEFFQEAGKTPKKWRPWENHLLLNKNSSQKPENHFVGGDKIEKWREAEQRLLKGDQDM